MRDLTREMAAPWVALQLPEGTFPDYLHGDKPPRSTRYGEAIMGYALVQTGIRENDEQTVDAGLRALDWFVGRRDLQRDHPSVFANASVASAYNLARRRLDDHPRFAASRPRWERWLRRTGLLWLPDTSHYGNKYLVDAVAVLELLRSGLESNERGSILADRDMARRRATRLLNLRVPRMAEREGCPIAGDKAFVLSDPGAGSPIAYHGLSLGFYARALDLLGAHTADAARDTLRQVGHCSWGITAPDGDLAYFGRSQEQAWALSLAAYGALSAAAISKPAAAARLRDLAARAVDRLGRRYGVGPKGLFITPSLRPDYRGTRGLDSYAAAIGYSGLTLAGLNWAIDRFGELDLDAAHETDAGESFVHRVTTVSPRNEFTVVRRRWWFVVKSAASLRAQDLRYDFGLVALKARAASGDWIDVIPARPKTKEGPDSAGPVLRRSRGVGLPEAESVSVGRDGTVTLTGGYRTANGSWLRRGVRFRFEPIDAGVRVIVPTEPGDRVKYAAFFRDTGSRPAVEDDRVFDDEQLVTFHPPATVAFDSHAYASGADARLIRANILFPESTGDAIRVTVGPR